MSEEVSIDSKKISELERTSRLRDEDYLVVERSNTSYKISFANLKRYIGENLARMLNLQSMAFKESTEFAKFAHGHDYSDFWFFPAYGPDSKNPTYPTLDNCQKVGEFKVTRYLPGKNRSETRVIQAAVPSYQHIVIDQVSGAERFHAGDLVFIGCSKFEIYLKDYRKYSIIPYAGGHQNIDINAESFDGFVIPNGTTFSCSSSTFKDACKIYSSSKQEDATAFTVPNLTTFFKCNPGVQKTNAMQQIPFQNALPSHQHDGVLKTNYTIDPLILDLDSFWQYSGNTKSGAPVPLWVHGSNHGSIASKQTEIRLNNIELEASVKSASIEDMKDNIESHPKYNSVPCLLYIGKKERV